MTNRPVCDWPRSLCYNEPTERPLKGGMFCPEHYKAWAEVMHGMLDKYSISSMGRKPDASNHD